MKISNQVVRILLIVCLTLTTSACGGGVDSLAPQLRVEQFNPKLRKHPDHDSVQYWAQFEGSLDAPQQIYPKISSGLTTIEFTVDRFHAPEGNYELHVYVKDPGQMNSDMMGDPMNGGAADPGEPPLIPYCDITGEIVPTGPTTGKVDGVSRSYH